MRSVNGKWSAKGKWLALRLNFENEELSHEIHEAFNQLLSNDKKDEIFKVIDMVLNPFGGIHFKGHPFIQNHFKGHPFIQYHVRLNTQQN